MLFKKAIEQELLQSRSNNFGKDNYDESRFGKMSTSSVFSNSFKNAVKRVTGYNARSFPRFVKNALHSISRHDENLELVYKHLSTEDKSLYVKLMAYRLLGYKKVKLPRNNSAYWQALSVAKTLKNTNDTYDPHFLHLVLEKFDLTPVGHDVKFYFNDAGVAIDFIIEQYAYKLNNITLIQAEKGDVVLDVGGCWGDTALYFANKVGSTGQVYSFEFIPDNIKLFKINTSLNPALQKHIELVPNPISNISGSTIYFRDNGPSSQIMAQPFEGQTGLTTTLTIDDFVAKNKIDKVDFIKMDIEGAESLALKGAVETIKKFKPTLAIAIYHSLNDFVNIPKWILDLDLGYEIFIGHYTIHAEETVCFAKLKTT